MQHIKDISRTEKISQFVTKQSIRSNPFGDNRLAERAYARAERLVSATYLVTRHIDTTESVKQALRQKGVELLGALMETRESLRTIGAEEVQEVQGIIRQVISLVRILAVSGFLSFENADILSDAYDELASFVDSARRSSLAESVYLSREELLGSDNRSVQYGSQQSRRRGQEMSDSRGMELRTGIKDIDTEESLKDTEHHNTDKQTIGQISVNSMVSPKPRRDRVEAITTVLREAGSCGIKDIMLHTPEYSEKMVQRTLFELVSLGIVVKNGSKRWSTYQLTATE